MLYGIKQARQINKFVEVHIPPLRDMYIQYGERLSKGEHTCSVTDHADVPCAQVSGQSTIEQMIRAQKMLEKETAKK